MKAIFLDRDGTIIKDKNYLADPLQIEWLANAVEGLRCLKEKGYIFFLITNQSGLGRGYFSLKDLASVHEKLELQMEQWGIGRFQAIEFCPHTPDDNCLCRKPKTLMLERIFSNFKIDKLTSWMIGDKDIDALCGINAGINSALIGKEYGAWGIKNNIPVWDDLLQFAQSV